MKLNWGFGIGAVYVLFALCMIFFAVIASQQNYDLVTDNYYEDAVNYQQQIDAGKNALNMDTKLTVTYLSDRHALEIKANGDQKNIAGTISFYKPDNAFDDFKIDFLTGASGMQLIPLKELAHGYWDIKINWKMEEKNCYTGKRIYIQ